MSGHFGKQAAALWVVLFTTVGFLQVWAAEEGEFVKKGGRWQYLPTEDPGLRYLLEKGLITQEEYDKGARILETRQRARDPGYSVSWGNGLNIKVGEKFFLKLRTQLQLRYTHHEYNQAWRLIGDSNNFSAQPDRQNESSASTFGARYIRLQFLGYAFDPDLRYNLTLAADQQEGNLNGTGNVSLLDASVTSWHIPYATVQVGQYRTWFNREQITSVATLSFVDRNIVAEAFTANTLNRRDIGIAILSDESKYRFNYAIGVYNGAGINTDRLGAPVSQGGANTRFNANELMYVARLLWNVSGRPGYGEGDILYSRVPQVAIAGGYAYNPGVNLVDPTTPIRNQILATGNGRLLGAGFIDFQTWEVDVIAKYRGWALQAEGFIRQQSVRGGNSELGNATGWYVQLGKYVIPRKMEVALRYGVMDPNVKQTDDLIKEAGVAVSYSFDGTYNHRMVMDYGHITMGTGGYAAGRATLAAAPGFGRDLLENRFRVMYQFYW
ncbi:MAG: porin [Nitrospiraceae bacterium]